MKKNTNDVRDAIYKAILSNLKKEEVEVHNADGISLFLECSQYCISLKPKVSLIYIYIYCSLDLVLNFID